MSEPISERLRDVICAELGLDNYPLNMDTLASEVPGWDSLAHVRVLVAVEEAFGFRIRSMEAIRLRNVGDLHQLVMRKSAS